LATEPTTVFIPGAGPPPVRIAIASFIVFYLFNKLMFSVKLRKDIKNPKD
jgi:hypothetical protein